MFGDIKKLLEEKEVQYELIYHENPILKTKDAEKYFNIEKAAPVLIIKADNNYFAFIKGSVNTNIDFKRLKEIINCENIRLARNDEVLNITGFKIGEIPLVGMKIPYIFDIRLKEYDFIYGGTGNPNYTLKINPNSAILLNNINIFYST